MTEFHPMKTKKHTRIFKIDRGALRPDELALVTRILGDDGVMAYPTETFYGLGASAVSETAVEKIYDLKQRDRGKPLSVVISDFAMAERYSESLPPLAAKLAGKFWPGPLTLVLRAKPVFPGRMLGSGGTLALRVPPVPWLLELVHALGHPLTATSANLSGEVEISDPANIIPLFRGKLDLIIDGGRTPGGLTSTIVDLTSYPPRILRPGAVPSVLLQDFLGGVS
jgi:L-threonylcarbamoyladenylate synthase